MVFFRRQRRRNFFLAPLSTRYNEIFFGPRGGQSCKISARGGGGQRCKVSGGKQSEKTLVDSISHEQEMDTELFFKPQCIGVGLITRLPDSGYLSPTQEIDALFQLLWVSRVVNWGNNTRYYFINVRWQNSLKSPLA